MTHDGRSLDLGRPKQRAVLVTLLIHANHVVSLDVLADTLWPEEGAPRSPGSLPVYIAQLRRLVEPERPARMPPERIITRAPGYLLRVRAGEYDAADFERLAAAGNRHLSEGRPRAARAALGEGLALWRGPALPEFPFAEMEALRLEGLRVAATEDRLQADLALGAHTAVVAELEQLVQTHGLRERLLGLLMLALYRSGRQGEALRAFAAAREQLRRELGIEPGPELRRLEIEILNQAPELEWRPPPAEGMPPEVRPEPEPALPPSAAFFGRVAELSALDRALGGGTDTAGSTILLSGEAGIGKTRLIIEAVARATAGGSVVVWGRCEEGDGAPPFWPWIQVIRALLDHPDPGAVRAALARYGPELAQLVPEVKELIEELAPPPQVEPAAARFRFLDAVGGFLVAVAQARPVVVVLDDLHWADPPSLQLTAHVTRRLPGSGLRVLAGYRHVDPPPHERFRETLATLARHPGVLHMSLGGLTHEEVAQFVAYETGAEPEAGAVATVWSRAGGNPFFVRELIRLLVAEKALEGPAAATAGVPWAVRQVVERRLARLPEATRQLLTVASVAGHEFDLLVVATVAEVDLDGALDLIDVAVAAGVIRELITVPGRFEFSHDLVQETVYAEPTRLRRARLHERVAQALEQVAGALAPATEIAHHLYEAVPVTGPGPAIDAAVRASKAAQAALAPEVAQGLLYRALGLVATMAPGLERDRHELEVQDQLAALLTLVKGVADPETAAAWARATELCQTVGDRRRLVPSLWGLLSYAWASGDLGGARILGEHLLSLGRASSDPGVTAAARLGLGSVAVCAGDLDEGARQLVEGKELADAVAEDLLAEVTYADLRVQVDSWLGMARHLQGDAEAGGMLVEGALRRARALGDVFTVALGLAFAVFGRLLEADTAAARLLAEELLTHAGRYQMPDFAFHARVARLWALAQAGEVGPSAIEELESLPEASAAGIRPWRPFWLALTAEVSVRLDRKERARMLLDEAWSEVEAMGSSFAEARLSELRGQLD